MNSSPGVNRILQNDRILSIATLGNADSVENYTEASPTSPYTQNRRQHIFTASHTDLLRVQSLDEIGTRSRTLTRVKSPKRTESDERLEYHRIDGIPIDFILPKDRPILSEQRYSPEMKLTEGPISTGSFSLPTNEVVTRSYRQRPPSDVVEVRRISEEDAIEHKIKSNILTSDIVEEIPEKNFDEYEEIAKKETSEIYLLNVTPRLSPIRSFEELGSKQELEIPDKVESKNLRVSLENPGSEALFKEPVEFESIYLPANLTENKSPKSRAETIDIILPASLPTEKIIAVAPKEITYQVTIPSETPVEQTSTEEITILQESIKEIVTTLTASDRKSNSTPRKLGAKELAKKFEATSASKTIETPKKFPKISPVIKNSTLDTSKSLIINRKSSNDKEARSASSTPEPLDRKDADLKQDFKIELNKTEIVRSSAKQVSDTISSSMNSEKILVAPSADNHTEPFVGSTRVSLQRNSRQSSRQSPLSRHFDQSHHRPLWHQLLQPYQDLAYLHVLQSLEQQV
ncbi:hypothetical protein HK096_005333 [Nowakowskiella sp. JEL0078]|nr:hypothetical protein HK096_005333 [Nowakowskiella sp. JEL0078]